MIIEESHDGIGVVSRHCHARGFSRASMFLEWIPACAGMTNVKISMKTINAWNCGLDYSTTRRVVATIAKAEVVR